VSRAFYAKLIGKLNQRGQQYGRIGIGGRKGVVGEQVNGAALLVEHTQSLEIARERALLRASGNAGANEFEWSV
jgi:hypothetical protein